MQYVGVKFRTGPDRIYSYQWGGEKELKIGERVVVPANYWNPVPSFGDVVCTYAQRGAISYKGELATIMGVVDEDGTTNPAPIA